MAKALSCFELRSFSMEQKKLFIDWDISPLLEIILYWSRRRSIFVDLDLLLESRFIDFQDSFMLPLNFETLVAKYCRLSFVLRLLTLFLNCR